MDLQYVWIAKYNDGTDLIQKEDHKFADIKQDKLVALEIRKNQTDELVAVVPFPKGAELICFVRGYISKDTSGQERHTREFWFGYKQLVNLQFDEKATGITIKNMLVVREDGLILLMNESGRDD